jgi:GR25 family glycosyltransferase involved in LPS biosynthesis
MTKNIGKKKIIEDVVEKLSGTIWNGVDKSIYDENGILIKKQSSEINTRAAKEAKINLLKHFLDTNKSDYLILFEDDILIHKNFYDYFYQTLNFANIHKFKLIYFGVSCYVPSKNNENLSINIIPSTNYRFSGAYGVIIHKSVMQTIISKSNDPFLLNKPFDVYSLGHIQLSYPNECFICDPQIVIPIISSSDIRQPREQDAFWNLCHIQKENYVSYKSIPMYILTDNNEEKIRRFIEMLTMLIPYVIPIFIYTHENTVQKLYHTIYTTIQVNSLDEKNISTIIHDKMYILTNIYVNWTTYIGNIFNRKNNISYKISNCPLCHTTNDIICNNDILNGFKYIQNDGEVIMEETKDLYYVYGCHIDRNQNMHDSFSFHRENTAHAYSREKKITKTYV